MKAFPYEKVYLYRKSQEDKKAQELARVERAKMLYQQQIDKIAADISSSAEALHQKMLQGHLQISWVQIQANFERTMQEKLRFLHKKLSQVEELVQKHKAELVDATTNRRIFEKLKEKFIQTEAAKVAKQEENYFNEVSIQRFHFQRPKA